VFRRFFHREPAPAPDPDTTHQPSIAGQSVVEVIYARSQRERAIITRDAQGIFRVRTEFWDTSDWEVAAAAYWCQQHLGTFTDTLAHARQLACEHLHESNPNEADTD